MIFLPLYASLIPFWKSWSVVVIGGGSLYFFVTFYSFVRVGLSFSFDFSFSQDDLNVLFFSDSSNRDICLSLALETDGTWC